MFASSKDTQQQTAGVRQSDASSNADVQDAEIVEVCSLCNVAACISALLLCKQRDVLPLL
jgi:hypothetical protein